MKAFKVHLHREDEVVILADNEEEALNALCQENLESWDLSGWSFDFEELAEKPSTGVVAIVRFGRCEAYP
jgi:hypothetical protein